ANRVTSEAPTAASSVLPAAIPSEVAIEPAVVTLTRNAAQKIAGHTPGPRRRNAASAIPVGAPTGVALGWTLASIKPSFPAARYASATPAKTRARPERSIA